MFSFHGAPRPLEDYCWHSEKAGFWKYLRHGVEMTFGSTLGTIVTTFLSTISPVVLIYFLKPRGLGSHVAMVIIGLLIGFLIAALALSIASALKWGNGRHWVFDVSWVTEPNQNFICFLLL